MWAVSESMESFRCRRTATLKIRSRKGRENVPKEVRGSSPRSEAAHQGCIISVDKAALRWNQSCDLGLSWSRRHFEDAQEKLASTKRRVSGKFQKLRLMTERRFRLRTLSMSLSTSLLGAPGYFWNIFLFPDKAAGLFNDSRNGENESVPGDV